MWQPVRRLLIPHFTPRHFAFVLRTKAKCWNGLLSVVFYGLESVLWSRVGRPWGNSPDRSWAPIEPDLSGAKLIICLSVTHTVSYNLLSGLLEKLKHSKQVLRGFQSTDLAVGSYSSSKVMSSALHLEGITVGYSCTFTSTSQKEMAYFCRGDPVPMREVANHMKLARSSLFAHSNLHRWERMGCWGIAQRRPCLVPSTAGGSTTWIHPIHQFHTRACSAFK